MYLLREVAMRRQIAVRALSWVGLASLVALAAAALPSIVGGERSASAAEAAQPAAGEQKAQPAAEAAKETTPSPKPAKTKEVAQGRLPAHFSGVVTDEQRQKIYAIQKDSSAKITPLRRQLESLIKERDEKIWALLTPEQRRKVEALKADAKKAGKAKQDAETKPAKPAKKPAKEVPPERK